MSSDCKSAEASIDRLGALIFPLGLDEFLKHYWGSQFVHVSGSKQKFSDLLSWKELSQALEQYPFEPPRMRLVKAGEQISSESYLEARLHRKESRLKVTEFIDQLRHGATLVLDFAEEIFPAVRDLASALERFFRARVCVNLYAAFGSDNGFPLHWDNHDTIILQLDGRKKWTVFEPTGLFPMQEALQIIPEPCNAPIWEGLLEEGSLFYIPRGWWHLVCPLSEPSLHLTITIKNYNSTDFLQWFMNRLRRSPIARMDIPLLKTPEEHQLYLEALRRELLQNWTSDLLIGFMSEMDSQALPRPQLRLPEAATPEGINIRLDTKIKLTSLRPLVILESSDDGFVGIKCNKRMWKCSKLVLPVLRRMNDGGSHTLRELFEEMPTVESKSAVHQFLTGLTQAGIVVTELDSSSQQQCLVGST